MAGKHVDFDPFRAYALHWSAFDRIPLKVSRGRQHTETVSLHRAVEGVLEEAWSVPEFSMVPSIEIGGVEHRIEGPMVAVDLFRAFSGADDEMRSRGPR